MRVLPARPAVALFVTSCHSNPKHYPNMGRDVDEYMSKFYGFGTRDPPFNSGRQCHFFYNKTLMRILFCVRLKTEWDKWFATAFGYGDTLI